MVDNLKDGQSFASEQEETIDLRKLLEKLIEHWKWFVVAIPRHHQGGHSGNLHEVSVQALEVL